MLDSTGDSGDSPASRTDLAIVLGEVKELFLFRLTAIARDAGIVSAPAGEALRRGAGRFYDEITRRVGRAGFAQARDLTASKIQLINDDQLELSIRLGELSRRLFENCQVSLWRLHLRFITLLERPDLEGTDNPVGPEGICSGLGEMLGEIGGQVPQLLGLLRDVEEALARDLPPLYADLNELLVRHGVAQARRPGPQEAAAPWLPGSTAAGGSTAPSGDPFAALQRLMLDRLAPTAAAGTAVPPPGTAATGTATASLAAPAGLGQDMFERLLARLNALQQPASGSLDLFGAAEPAPPPRELEQLKSGELSALLNSPEEAAIDVLAMVFAAVFDNPRLPDAVKAAIGRLQIPLVKAAMIDPSFFDNRSQPARALLDHMARAAVGLPRDAGADHPICAKLHQIALHIQSEFDRDLEVFDHYAADLETFVARRDHAIQKDAEDFVALGEEQERRDLAAIDAQRAVAAALSEGLPAVIVDFARGHWCRVLEAVHRQHGADSREWQAQLQVLNDLTWSVRPKQDPEARKRLGGLVADLLRRINEGLNRISLGSAERATFLDACFALQTAALRGKPAPPPAADAAFAYPPDLAATGDDLLEPQLTALQSGPRLLEAIRLPRGAGTGRGKLATLVKTGDWVEFMLPGGELRCGRLCWISPALRCPLFFNAGWEGAISLVPAILERQLRDGIASIQSARSLFDTMAEKALRAITAGH